MGGFPDVFLVEKYDPSSFQRAHLDEVRSFLLCKEKTSAIHALNSRAYYPCETTKPDKPI